MDNIVVLQHYFKQGINNFGVQLKLCEKHVRYFVSK